jgi:hypothetical protein
MRAGIEPRFEMPIAQELLDRGSPLPALSFCWGKFWRQQKFTVKKKEKKNQTTPNSVVVLGTRHVFTHARTHPGMLGFALFAKSS